MKIRPIFKTIDIFSFIQFLSRQTNYIIKFFLLKVLYLVRKSCISQKMCLETLRRETALGMRQGDTKAGTNASPKS